MNREQAGHILDAYVQIRMLEFGPDVSDALCEVILDAMTEYKSSTITVPNVIYSQPTPNYVKPIVTCEVGE